MDEFQKNFMSAMTEIPSLTIITNQSPQLKRSKITKKRNREKVYPFLKEEKKKSAMLL